ncbi:ABC transporter, ATP-binding protein [Parvimonas sp. KA00067]|uniref:ATP-binding cassette domain-containing protein n=1 Tax=Parvimonas sp. KA00067 TaxID=1588755 RepID=UPI0007966D6C|nr:ABC transporter ATP-binding protein [Parvimonas sp. KA00067]KXB64791.1 ABC transporter, ATP-binding protein [Parvimonas sp. KA00067]
MMNNIFKAIKLVFNLDKKRFLINYGIFILESLSFVFTIYALQLTLEKLGLFISGKLTTSRMLIYISVFILIKILTYTFRSFMGFYCEYYDLVLSSKIEKTLMSKELLPIYFEDNNFLDILSQAKLGASNLTYITNAYIDVVFMYGFNFLFLAVYLFLLSPYFVLILVVVLLLQFLHNKFDKKIETKLEENLKKLRRKREYFESLFLDKETVKELKTFDTTEYFLQRFNLVTEEFCDVSEIFYKKLLVNDFRLGLLKIICYLISYVIIYVLKDKVSIAEFGVIFVTIRSIFSLSEEGFYGRIKDVNSLLPQLDAFFKILDMNYEKNIIYDNMIIFENVSFKYPNTNEYALKNINFKIKTNEKIGVVGVNGSGKSTISKLILGLYEQTEGKIKIAKSSAVFQDFSKYEISSIENVKISDYQKEVDLSRFKEIDYFSENDLDYNKILSKRFSDVSISQGQWQKLAILRGLHKNEEFFVFDEPTWAIDPVVEKKIFDFLYNHIHTGMIVVTHNLSSVKQMDKILVLDKGEIVGFDTHLNLIKNNKLYKQLWFTSTM